MRWLGILWLILVLVMWFTLQTRLYVLEDTFYAIATELTLQHATIRSELGDHVCSQPESPTLPDYSGSKSLDQLLNRLRNGNPTELLTLEENYVF